MATPKFKADRVALPERINVTHKTVSATFPAQWRKCEDCGNAVPEGGKLFYTRKGKKIKIVQCADCVLALVQALAGTLERTV
jgi:hypothetical protein